MTSNNTLGLIICILQSGSDVAVTSSNKNTTNNTINNTTNCTINNYTIAYINDAKPK